MPAVTGGEANPSGPNGAMSAHGFWNETCSRQSRLNLQDLRNPPFYGDALATCGRHSRRPGWRKLIRDLKAGRFRVVVFHRIDRVFRNVSSVALFLELTNRYHVRVMFVDEPFDTSRRPAAESG